MLLEGFAFISVLSFVSRSSFLFVPRLHFVPLVCETALMDALPCMLVSVCGCSCVRSGDALDEAGARAFFLLV